MGVVAVNNFGDNSDGGMAGPMGLFVVVLLVIATVLLIRNMNRRLRRLPDSFAVRQPTQREAEVARLNAEIAAPAAVTDRPNVDSPRSDAAPAAAEGEVTAINTQGDAPSAAGDDGRV